VKTRFRRTFKQGICGDWVEIYKQTPAPKFDGGFVFVFRRKRERKVLPLMSGLTAGGAEIIIKSLTQRPGLKLSDTLVRVRLMIMDKMNDPHLSPVLLPR